LLRADELLRKLDGASGENLLFETGGLLIGTKARRVFSGSLSRAREHQLPHEVLDAFSGLATEAGLLVLCEKRAGYGFKNFHNGRLRVIAQCG